MYMTTGLLSGFLFSDFSRLYSRRVSFVCFIIHLLDIEPKTDLGEGIPRPDHTVSNLTFVELKHTDDQITKSGEPNDEMFSAKVHDEEPLSANMSTTQLTQVKNQQTTQYPITSQTDMSDLFLTKVNGRLQKHMIMATVAITINPCISEIAPFIQAPNV